MADDLQHDAVRIEEVRRVCVLAVLGEDARRVDDLGAPLRCPLVGSAYDSALWSREREMLQSGAPT